MCRKGLSQQAWVAQTLRIPKKSLYLGLAVGQLFGDELLSLELFCLINILASQRPWTKWYLFDQIIYGNNVFYAVFALKGWHQYLRSIEQLLHAQHGWLLIKKPDIKAQVSSPANNTLHLWTLCPVAGKIPHAHMLLLGEDTWKF